MQLNDSQQKAVCHMNGPCLVLAGPGSGKTAVLTQRVNYLITSGIPAKEILVITFTKAAAIEMKERFERLSDDIYPVTFGTFHSLFWGILQKELGYKSSDIVMGQSRNKIIREAMAKANLDYEDSILVRTIDSELSIINNSTENIESYIPKYVDKHDLIDFGKAYNDLKKKYRVIDFDDMLTKTYELFEKKPDVLRKWQSRFSYFLVDEMQDMNDIQFKLISMLAARTNNIFCVGDDDQSIYGFRGANPKLMDEFKQIYANTEIIVLDYNYRNPSNIVTKAGNLISKNSLRFPKHIKATAEDGGIIIEELEDEAKEADFIINKINELKEQGIELDEMAILYRNHSDARYIVDKLVASEIPFYLKEKMPNIYSHFIIYDLENYFQIAIGNETRARLLGIINRPNRFLHRRSVEFKGTLRGMREFYQDNKSGLRATEALIADINLISKMSPCAAINYIKNVMGYENFLKEEAAKQNVDYAEYRDVLDFFIEMSN